MLICKLRELMEKRKLTIQELSKLSEVNIPTLESYCQNKIKEIRFETLDKLCKALNCNTNDLFANFDYEYDMEE